MAFAVASYFVKKKSLYLFFQSLCIVFLIVSYFFTVQFFAMVGLSIGLMRTITYFLFEKKNAVAPLWIPLVISAVTLASYVIVNFWILKTANLWDILCLLALLFYAFIFRIRNLKTVRYTMLVPLTLSVLYNLVTGAAVFATLSYGFELCANMVSIWKYHIYPELKKTPAGEEKQNSEEETATSATGN